MSGTRLGLGFRPEWSWEARLSHLGASGTATVKVECAPHGGVASLVARIWHAPSRRSDASMASRTVEPPKAGRERENRALAAGTREALPQE